MKCNETNGNGVVQSIIISLRAYLYSGSAPVTLRWCELVYPSGGVLVDAMSVLPATPVALYIYIYRGNPLLKLVVRGHIK